MRLIDSDFGFNDGDPAVPEVRFAGREDDDGCRVTTLRWVSVLPAAADESVVAMPLAERVVMVEEFARTAGGVEHPWGVQVGVSDTRIEVAARVTGAAGWVEDLGFAGERALGARAAHVCAAVWAAWHATGHSWNPDQVMGILWLVGAGMRWSDAVATAGSLAAS